MKIARHFPLTIVSFAKPDWAQFVQTTASRSNPPAVGKISHHILFLGICLRCWMLAGQHVALPGGLSLVQPPLM